MRKIIGLLLAVLLSNSSMAEVTTVLEMRAARDEARAMVFAQDFDGIEAKLSEYQKSKARTRDGHWKLAQFYGGVMAGFAELVSGNNMKSLEYVLLKSTYHTLFYNVIDSRHPLWGGSIQSSVKFINAFVKNATYEESVATYARLFVYLDSPLVDTARNEVLDWELMKKSFSAVLDKYPDDFNSQKYLLMACYRDDKADTKRLLAYVKEEPSAHSIGPETLMFKNCAKWASGGYTFAITNPKTGQVEFRR